MTTILIIFFSSISYLIGFYAIVKKGYRPSLFTRMVWLALALNNLYSVIKLGNEIPTISLAWVTFLGSLLILIGSIFKGERTFGRNEKIASVLLVASLLLWLYGGIPIINLLIGLIAHLIGSIPTVVRAVKEPESENIPFWFFFALGSLIAFLSTDNSSFKGYIFILYFLIFDSAMVMLSLRRYIKNGKDNSLK